MGGQPCHEGCVRRQDWGKINPDLSASTPVCSSTVVTSLRDGLHGCVLEGPVGQMELAINMAEGSWLGWQGRAERQEALEEGRAQSSFLQQALTPLLAETSELPFVIRLVADSLGLAGPTAMHALNAAVLAASSANFPLKHLVAGAAFNCCLCSNLSTGLDYRCTASHTG